MKRRLGLLLAAIIPFLILSSIAFGLWYYSNARIRERILHPGTPVKKEQAKTMAKFLIDEKFPDMSKTKKTTVKESFEGSPYWQTSCSADVSIVDGKGNRIGTAPRIIIVITDEQTGETKIYESN